jgi:hypothetical protein
MNYGRKYGRNTRKYGRNTKEMKRLNESEALERELAN